MEIENWMVLPEVEIKRKSQLEYEAELDEADDRWHEVEDE